jgi:hypothetical protein
MSPPDQFEDEPQSWLGRMPTGLWIALALVAGTLPWALVAVEFFGAVIAR